MDAYRVNPPLPRMIAALPLLVDRPVVDWHYSDSPYVRSEYQFAHRWVEGNAEAVPQYLLLARSMVLIFFLIGLWAIVRWASRMYGTRAAWLVAAMWSLNPDIITNSAVVAPDLPASAMGLLAGYSFWDWLGRSVRPFPWTVAACVALAILCKFSWLFLLPALPFVTIIYDLRSRSKPSCSALVDSSAGQAFLSRLDRYTDAAKLALSFSLTLLIVNWCYGFEGTATRLGDFDFISASLAGSGIIAGETDNRFSGGLLALVPIPLPSEMVLGLDYLNWEFERGMPCYLRGVWKGRGWWYFHLYAMAVKIPSGYWILIAGGFASMIWRCRRPARRYRLEWLPVLIVILFVAMVSSQTGFTHHVRYVLPAYGFLFLLASRVMVDLPKRFAIGLAVVCLSGTVWFHATHLGLAHTFFNPVAGGPNNGWRHLSHSNVDWGQSTYRMVDWIKEHPEQRPMTVLFRSSLGNPQQLVSDIEGVSTKTGWQKNTEAEVVPDRVGWFLISSYQMTLKKNRYFSTQTPVAQPDPDILLFYYDANQKEEKDGDEEGP